MMRYRRNRASTMEAGGGGGAQNHPSSSNPAGSQMPQQQQQQQLLPSSIGYGAGASASGAPWTAMYQGSAGMKASGAASGVGVGGGSSGLLGAAAAGGRGGGGSGVGGGGPPSNWGISYGSNAVTASDGRPKSANFNAGQPTAAASNSLMASLTGAGRPSSSVQPSQVPLSTNWSSQQQQQQQSQSGQQQLSINNNSNTLSYGSLKNRFLSGTGGKSNMPSSSNNNVGASAAAGAGAGNKSSSKLFSLAR